MRSEGVSVFPGRRSANGRHRRVQGAGQRSGQQAAGSGAVVSITGRQELAGDDGLLDSEHRFAKGKHHGVEELTANVPRGLARAERGRGGRVAAAECVLLRRDPIREV